MTLIYSANAYRVGFPCAYDCRLVNQRGKCETESARFKSDSERNATKTLHIVWPDSYATLSLWIS
ncbi:unnamed protein product [Larinioides sclopetarius]|uniref:Uncharacterized protein n=1 Tax=Larinioides sclopetarius TaxID=280406 RepID=A0AAV1Z0G9_9ARAC